MPESPEILTQDELVAGLVSRDRKAFERLYDSYSPAIFGVMKQMLPNDEVAEEVLQDAFLKYWTKIDSYDASRGRLFTWMINIARNLAIDKLRSKEVKKGEKTDTLDHTVYSHESAGSVENKVEHIGLAEILGQLRDEEKTVLRAIFFSGLTHAEASEQLDIPLGTIKTRFRMGMKNLREYLGVT